MAALLFVVHVPKTVRSLRSAAASLSYVTSPEGRELTAGDGQGISYDLQAEALALIPPGSTYALLLPADQASADRIYGIQPVTYAVVGPYLRYELLPSVPATSDVARYIICWGCNTAPWDHRTTWLYTNVQGVSIGRVRGR